MDDKNNRGPLKRVPAQAYSFFEFTALSSRPGEAFDLLAGSSLRRTPTLAR